MWECVAMATAVVSWVLPTDAPCESQLDEMGKLSSLPLKMAADLGMHHSSTLHAWESYLAKTQSSTVVILNRGAGEP